VRVFGSFALAPVLSQLGVPLLVLHGEDGRLGPWDAEQAAAATLNSPRVGLVRGTAELGGAGHVWMDNVGRVPASSATGSPESCPASPFGDPSTIVRAHGVPVR
jgi:hypothetical protein